MLTMLVCTQGSRYSPTQQPNLHSAGPGTFQRCLAARQLACLVRQLDYEHLKGQVDRVLPHLVAVVKDQAPSVQSYGLHALQHLAKGTSHAFDISQCS